MDFLKLHMPGHLPESLEEFLHQLECMERQTILEAEAALLQAPAQQDQHAEMADAQEQVGKDSKDDVDTSRCDLELLSLLQLVTMANEVDDAFSEDILDDLDFDLSFLLWEIHCALRRSLAIPELHQKYASAIQFQIRGLMRAIARRDKLHSKLVSLERRLQRDLWERKWLSRQSDFTAWIDMVPCRQELTDDALKTARRYNTPVLISTYWASAGAVNLMEHWKLDHDNAVEDIQETNADDDDGEIPLAVDSEVYPTDLQIGEGMSLRANLLIPYGGSVQLGWARPGYSVMLVDERTPDLAAILSWLEDDGGLHRHPNLGLRHFWMYCSMTPAAYDERRTAEFWCARHV